MIFEIRVFLSRHLLYYSMECCTVEFQAPFYEVPGEGQDIQPQKAGLKEFRLV